MECRGKVSKEFVKPILALIGTEEVNAFNAREVYLDLDLDLGMDASNWAKWARVNISENTFFVQGIDFIELMLSTSSPNPPKEYAVSINMANHLAMMAKTERAHDYRNYFIELEKRFNDLSLKFLKLFEFEAKPAVTGASLLYRRWL